MQINDIELMRASSIGQGKKSRLREQGGVEFGTTIGSVLKLETQDGPKQEAHARKTITSQTSGSSYFAILFFFGPANRAMVRRFTRNGVAADLANIDGRLRKILAALHRLCRFGIESVMDLLNRHRVLE